MNITDVRIRKLPTDGKMKAIVSVTFDDEIVIHDIKIIEGAESLFIAMPSRKLPNGEFRDIAHPINSDARGKIEEAVFAKYDEILNEMEDSEELDETENSESDELL
ncbi:MAG: septation regulator SpoVG [Tissierellia bacterium]|nr:septation regulator SpoVG [Tissierellia bacterium]